MIRIGITEEKPFKILDEDDLESQDIEAVVMVEELEEIEELIVKEMKGNCDSQSTSIYVRIWG